MYRLQPALRAVAYTGMDNSTVRNLWKHFFLRDGELTLDPCEELVFRIGETAAPTLEAGKEYAIRVDEKGVCVAGSDYPGLMRGFMVLLMKIECLKDGFGIRHTHEQSGYLLKNRMIHICVFPENDLKYIKKLVRLAGLCQYTHIVIEFWGMQQYDCLPELAWPNAFTKAETKALVRECRELGMEPVPMFNMLGHAASCRVLSGKHVVLDQNPRYQHLYSPDGWVWNIESPEVRKLLKQVRLELYEVFGQGEYIHIGCDEAYYISRDKRLRTEVLPAYLRELTAEVEKEGRRPMIWMDMLQEKGKFKDCKTTGEAGEVEALRAAAAKSSVFVDWQYNCLDTPIPSLVSLKDCGHDVMGAPWYNAKNYRAHIDTIVENGLFGLMFTTWHTLEQYMPSILACAKRCGAVSFVWNDSSSSLEQTASLLRRVAFEGNTYEETGWVRNQLVHLNH